MTASRPVLPETLASMDAIRRELSQFMMQYRFGINEVHTKLHILREEFRIRHNYNPIEHIATRLKSPRSILEKAERRGIAIENVSTEMHDIAGVRAVCSFTHDVYRVQEMLCRQADLTVLAVKDYIENPKPNGYRSLHTIVEVPVYLSDRELRVPVEVQFRTIAQEFWASLEHKIFYKHNRDVPAELIAELKESADTAAALDAKMVRLSKDIRAFDPEEPAGEAIPQDVLTGFAQLLTK